MGRGFKTFDLDGKLTADIQPFDKFFVIPKNGRGQFGRHGISGFEELGQMTLGAGKVGLGSLLGRGDRQGTFLEIFGHEDPVVHAHQGPGMMGFFPLGVNLRMAFLAAAGIIAVDQFR